VCESEVAEELRVVGIHLDGVTAATAELLTDAIEELLHGIQALDLVTNQKHGAGRRRERVSQRGEIAAADGGLVSSTESAQGVLSASRSS